MKSKSNQSLVRTELASDQVFEGYWKVKELLIPFDFAFLWDLDQVDGGCLGMGFILRLVSSGSNLQREKLA
ncbi:hypothetical protein AJ88_13710 [Mesorhizobium amorphae CCBAU 01583]|nr:hypothetical protein AJ88_13710 [Mesorhizobium amorphae CCBAU 01583]